MVRGHVTVALAFALLGAAGPASADEPNDAGALLAEARREKEALQYGRALELLERALSAGGSGPDVVADIVRMAAEVAAGLERPEVARDYFERLLVLRPDTSYPAGTSPKLAEPFAAARRALSGRALVVRHAVPADAPPRVVVTVESDPLRSITAAVVRWQTRGGRAGVARAAGRERIVVPVPADAATIVVAALDLHGNELVVHGSESAPIAVGGTSLAGRGSTEPASSARPVWARWYWWAGATVVFAGVASLFGLQALSTQDEIDRRNLGSGGYQYEDTLALERRGEREALFANVGFALAGATLLAGALVLAFVPSGPPPEGP